MQAVQGYGSSDVDLETTASPGSTLNDHAAFSREELLAPHGERSRKGGLTKDYIQWLPVGLPRSTGIFYCSLTTQTKTKVFAHLITILGLCYHFSPLWRNPSLNSFHWCLSWANLVQVVPRCRLRSSLHLVFGLPRGLNHLRGTQDVTLMVHLLSWSLATWPAHRCFDCLMWSMMSVTHVCCRIRVLCLWSRRVMPSIILSIFLCATASASIWAVVKAQVSLPYVITGSTYSLNTFSWSACLLCGFSWCCLPCWRQPIPKWYVSWSLALGLHPLKLSFPGRRTFQPLLWLFHRLRLWPSQCDYLAWSWFFPGAYWGPLVCYSCWCRQAFLVVLVEYVLSGLCHRRRLGGKGARHLCWFLSPPSRSYWWWHPGGTLWRALENVITLSRSSL